MSYIEKMCCVNWRFRSFVQYIRKDKWTDGWMDNIKQYTPRQSLGGSKGCIIRFKLKQKNSHCSEHFGGHPGKCVYCDFGGHFQK